MLDHFRNGEAILYMYAASLLLLPIVGLYLWLDEWRKKHR